MSTPRIPLFCAAAAIVAGLAVIVGGWCLDVAVLRSVAPGTVTMKTSTAAMFVLCGVALALIAGRPTPLARRAAAVCVAVVIVYSLAYLSEYVIHVDLGIDEFPFRDEQGRAKGVAFPGRLAPLTAISFVLVGLAVLALDARRWLVDLLVAPVAAIGATCLIGYLYSLPAFYGPSSAAKMAINTAVLFLVLAAGVLLARPRGRVWVLLTTGSAGGIMARRLSPLAVLVPLLFGWIHLTLEQHGTLSSRAAAWWLTATTIAALLVVIARAATTLNRGLRDADRRFETAFDHAPIGIALVDLDGRIFKVNRALRQITGHDESRLISRHFRDLVHPDDLGGLQRGRDLMLGGGGDVAGAERRYLRSDGTELWVLQSTALVRGEDGQPRHFIAQVQDISQQREDERLKEEFVSVVTHELSTPLTSVAGYLDVVLEEDEDVPALDPHHAHCVAVARRNTQRLVDLVEDLLLVRRLEAGREHLTRESLDLSALVEDRLESAEPMAGAKAIAVEGDIASGVIVDADPRRLAQVVDNLLSNAIKYTPDGGAVELALRVDAGLAELVVTDSGIGIPESEHAHLFNAFFRASNVSSGAVPGTGLGLVVTRRLIEAHGGTIDFESAEGEGSTFVVHLPAAISGPAAPAPAASAAAA